MKNQVKKHGGKRSGAGRPKGTVNKATADIRARAQEYTDEALSILLSIARNEAASEAARVAAAKDILDRGHGKPRQTIDANVKRSVTDMSEEDLALLAGIDDGESEQG